VDQRPISGELRTLTSLRGLAAISVEPLRDGILNILLLPGFGIGVNLNGPSWTISNEFAA